MRGVAAAEAESASRGNRAPWVVKAAAEVEGETGATAASVTGAAAAARRASAGWATPAARPRLVSVSQTLE
jgi:hypothetical protein